MYPNNSAFGRFNSGYAPGLMARGRPSITSIAYAGKQARMMSALSRAGTSRGFANLSRRALTARGGINTGAASAKQVAIDNARGKTGSRAPGAFVRQLRALVAGKQKDAADVSRITVAQAATTISCLTSSTDFATAASGTGLLDMDGDSALINSVTLHQHFDNACLEDVTPVGLSDVEVRTITF